MLSGLFVFGWHNVDSTWCFPSPGHAGREGLAEQLRWLARCAHVMPLGDALAALAAGERLPANSAAITFDDGYHDNLELAVPLLERHSLPATFFLVPALLDGLPVAWWERVAWAFAAARARSIAWEGLVFTLDSERDRRDASVTVGERLKRRNSERRAAAVDGLVELLDPQPDNGRRMFMNWTEAKELVARGFEVGSHSMRHSILSQETLDEQRRDLTESRAQLRARLQVPVELLAYPNGGRADYSTDTLTAARDAGYRYAVTTLSGRNRGQTPPFEIRRYVMYPEQGAVGFLKVAKHGARGWWHARRASPLR